MSYQRLIEDHDLIDQLARKLETIAEADCAEPVEAVRVLMNLSCAVSEHLAYEDRTVYSRLIDAKPRLAEPAIDFEQTFQQLRADWLAYLSDWNGETLTLDWACFCDETKAMMARLRTRVGDETDLIYPTAMQRGLIRLRCEYRPGTSASQAATSK